LQNDETSSIKSSIAVAWARAVELVEGQDDWVGSGNGLNPELLHNTAPANRRDYVRMSHLL
jgi:hypothetical protein